MTVLRKNHVVAYTRSAVYDLFIRHSTRNENAGSSLCDFDFGLGMRLLVDLLSKKLCLRPHVNCNLASLWMQDNFQLTMAW